MPASQANKVVSSDSLIELVWSKESVETSSHSFEVYVSQPRNLPEPGGRRRRENSILVRKPPGYLLQPGPDQLDMPHFQRLAQN